MRHVLIFGLIVVLIVVGVLEAFGRTARPEPYPLVDNSPGDYTSTVEEALDSYIWARNHRDYRTYLEALGENAGIEITTAMNNEMSLWGNILEYEVIRSVEHGDMVRLQLFQTFQAPNGNTFPNQRVSYYFIRIGNRWIYLPEGFDRSVLWWRAMMWDLF